MPDEFLAQIGRRLIAAADEGIVAVSADGRVRSVNRRFDELVGCGQGPHAGAGGGPHPSFDGAKDRARVLEQLRLVGVGSGAAVDVDVDVTLHDQAVLRCLGLAVIGSGGAALGRVWSVRKASEADGETGHPELPRLQTREEQQAFLLRVSQLVANAQDEADVLDRLAQAAVPTLGDLCLIDVLRGDGKLVRVAARHADPEFQPVVDELLHHYAPDPVGNHPSAEVIRSGRLRWSPVMSAEFLGSTTRGDHHLELVRRLRLRSYIAVPIFAASRVLGAIVLVSTARSSRVYGERDVELAYEFAGYAARAVADVERNDAAREAAQALQASLLLEELPQLPGFDLAVEYLPANVDHEVGGDFYDVIVTGDTAFLVVGDVAGHDIIAAGVMGKLRTAARVLADPADGAAGLLTRLHEQWLRVEAGRLATVVAAALDLRTGALRIASAGHPAPLMVVPSGEAVLDITPSPPLGAPSGPVPEWQGTLPEGWTLLLYTDGLVERPDRSWEAGMAELSAAVRGCVDPHRLCQRVLEQLMANPAHDDDVAVLALTRPVRA